VQHGYGEAICGSLVEETGDCLEIVERNPLPKNCRTEPSTTERGPCFRLRRLMPDRFVQFCAIRGKATAQIMPLDRPAASSTRQRFSLYLFI